MPRLAIRTVESENYVTDTLATLGLKAPKTANYIHNKLLPFLRVRIKAVHIAADSWTLLRSICELQCPVTATYRADRNIVSHLGAAVSIVRTSAGEPCITLPGSMDPGTGRLITMLWSACLLAQAGKTPTTSVPAMPRIYGANPAPLLLAQVLKETLPPSRGLTAAVAHLRSMRRQHLRHMAKPSASDKKAAGTLKDRHLRRIPAEALASPPAARLAPAALRREIRLRLLLADPFAAEICRALYDPLRADAARRAHALKEFQ